MEVFPVTDSDLVTTAEVAKRYGVTVCTVNEWVRQGRIPCVRATQKTVRFRLFDIENAFEQPARMKMNKQCH